MNDDRCIGRKEIIQFLNPIIGCTSWGAVRYQVAKKGMPISHAPNGKPFVVPKKINKWDEQRRRKAENN